MPRSELPVSRHAITWGIVALGLALAATPASARSGWQRLSARLGAVVDAELGLARQAVDLERAVAALEREQAGAEYSAAILDHAGAESVRRLSAYRAGRSEREQITRRRARAMVKAARGGVARLMFEDVGRPESTTADRLARGRRLRWLVRHDLRELSAYQRAELRARDELLHAERQLQALSALATVHDMQGELTAIAMTATAPALQRARKTRRALLSGSSADDRARRAHRERLAELGARWKELEALQGSGVEGTLVRPVRGRLVGRFGKYEDPVLRLPMVRHGVELAARLDETVRAPADGRVVMVAELPGFEQVVVIDHGAGQLSMLGRLWNVAVDEGDMVGAGDRIASVAPKATDDGLGTTAYLELRHGEKPVNPAPMLQRATRRR